MSSYKDSTTPWIEKSLSGTGHSTNASRFDLLILHNFSLIEENAKIVIKLFGIGNSKHFVIGTEEKAKALNGRCVSLKGNKIIDPITIEMFAPITSIRIDFVESEGLYYQIYKF